MASRSRLPTFKSSGIGTKFLLHAAKRMRDAKVASIEATYVYAKPWPRWRVLSESLRTDMHTHACFIQVVDFCVEVARGTESFCQHTQSERKRREHRAKTSVEWGWRTTGMDIRKGSRYGVMRTTSGNHREARIATSSHSLPDALRASEMTADSSLRNQSSRCTR